MSDPTPASTTLAGGSTTTDEPKVAHVVSKADWSRGYLAGEPVTALCGVVFVPTRDPERYPVCEPCQTERQLRRHSGSN